MPQFLLQVHREGCELLAERHGHRVLELGASELEDVLELLALVVEGIRQLLDRVRQLPEHVVESHSESRREGVVGGLAVVDVVIGVDDVVAALREPEMLQRQVRQDLVGVHVDRRAGTALEDVDRELVHAPSLFEHLVTGLEDGARHPAWQHPELPVRERSRLFHQDHAADQLRN